MALACEAEGEFLLDSSRLPRNSQKADTRMTTQKLHSVVSGHKDAPALLLLNSLGATNAMWDAHL